MVDPGEYWYKAACRLLGVRILDSMHHLQDIISLFNQCFKSSIQTELVKGEQEPIYLPRTQHYPYDRVIFARGFYSSALHEIAHWCIAGSNRRKLVDFGYWYNPDGRTKDQQVEFQQVETKPQALEWILSRSAAHRFNVSLDNLDGDLIHQAHAASTFKDNIYRQVQAYMQEGLPVRARQLIKVLLAFYRPQQPLTIEEFNRDDI